MRGVLMMGYGYGMGDVMKRLEGFGMSFLVKKLVIVKKSSILETYSISLPTP